MSYIILILNIAIIVALWTVNRSTSWRFTQWKIVVMALLTYAIPLYIYYDINNGSESLVRSFVSQEALDSAWTSMNHYKNMTVDMLPPVLKDDDSCLFSKWTSFNNCVLFMLNLLIVFIFFIVKSVLIFLAIVKDKLLGRKANKIEGVAKNFYTVKNGKIYLRNRYVITGMVAAWLGTAIMFTSLISIYIDFTDYRWLKNIHWSPFLLLAALVLMEIGFFLGGKQREVVFGKVDKDEEDAKTVVNFDPLLEAYKETLGENVIGSTVIHSQSDTVMASKGKTEQEIDSHFLKMAVEKMKKDHKTFKIQYIEGIDTLFSWRYKSRKKPNVLFSNAHDDEFAPYLKLFFSLSHIENKRIIIPLLTEIQKEKTTLWIKKLIEDEPYLLRDCHEFDYENKKNHILIDTIDTIVKNERLLNEMDSFHFVLLFDLKNFIRKNHLYLNNFLHLYKVKTGRFPQILGFSNLPNELEPSFNLIFGEKDDTKEIKIASKQKSDFYLLVVDAESRENIQEIFGINRGQYMGNEVPLAWYAYHHFGISPIVLSSESSSLDEELESLKNSLDNPSSIDERNFKQITHRYFNNLDKNHRMYIVDDIGNMAQTIQKWRNYANGDPFFLIVVASPYLFRNYFAANLDVISQNSDFYLEILPKGSLSRQERAFMLLLALSSSKVNRNNIYMKGIDVTRATIARFINDNLEDIEISPAYIHVEKEKYFDGLNFTDRIFYSIPKKRYKPKIHYFTFVNTQRDVIGTCIEDDIFQKYHEGMKITLHGRIYKIRSIDMHKNEIIIEFLASDKIPRYEVEKYLTFSKNITAGSVIDNSSQNGVHSVVLCKELDFVCHFPYYEEITTHRKIRLPDNIKRVYTNKKALCLRYATDGLLSKEIMQAYAFMLNEVFKVVFPRSHYLLHVYIEEKNSNMLYADDQFEEGEDMFSLWIIEMSYINYHLLTTLTEEHFFHKVLMLMEDYIDWSREEGKNITLNGMEEDKNKDFDGLKEFLNLLLLGQNEIRNNRKSVNASPVLESAVHPSNHHCDFCALPLYDGQYEKLDDARERCQRCSQQAQKHQNMQPEKMINEAMLYLEKKYGIEINRNVDVDIINSKELHKRIGSEHIISNNFDARAVGIAIQSDNEHKRILLENAAPYFREMSTLIHELTHIWQYDNLDIEAIPDRLKVLEGHAMYVELEFLNSRFSEQKNYIESEKNRDDIYGIGYRYMRDLVKNNKTKNPFVLLEGKQWT